MTNFKTLGSNVAAAGNMNGQNSYLTAENLKQESQCRPIPASTTQPYLAVLHKSFRKLIELVEELEGLVSSSEQADKSQDSAQNLRQLFDDQEWRQPGGLVPQEEEVDHKQIGRTLLENWQRKSARSCYNCLLPGYIAADFTTDKGQVVALRVILEWLATTHEAVLPKHDPRLAVRAWYGTNDLDFGRHDANFSVPHDNGGQLGWTHRLQGRKTCSEACGRKQNQPRKVSVFGRRLDIRVVVLFLLIYRFLLQESSRRGDRRVCLFAEDLRRHPSLYPLNAGSGQSKRAAWGKMVDGRVQAATFSL
jgi:hypothetical protein